LSSCHSIKFEGDISSTGKKVVLVGNPNVGKSLIFNYLTGMYVDVSNFPGTTVDISMGRLGDYTVMDTPGIYGVSSFNDEERVARDIILEADIVLNVIDATHLERDLFLTQQLIDMGKLVVVALNMMDDIERRGTKLDVERLSSELGVEVVPTKAVEKDGLRSLKDAIESGRRGNTIKEIEDMIDPILSRTNTEAEALLVLEEDRTTMEKYGIAPSDSLREYIYRARRKRVEAIAEAVISDESDRLKFRDNIGIMMLKPITGIPILLGTLFVMYQLLGVFIAQTVVGFTEDTLMNGYYHSFILSLTEGFLSGSGFLEEALIGEFGILTMVPIYMLGLLFPLVAGFYLFLSLLEDSGYLPRIAALVDRVLTKLGLNGRAIIPMILGLGCVTMATITTRLLGSKREKFIATTLLGIAIPCSAQLGVIMGLIAPLGFNIFILYIGVIFMVFVVAGTVLNKLLPGKSTHLFIDLPVLRVPRVSNIARKTASKSWMFLKEATPLFILGALTVTIMQHTGALMTVSNGLIPVTSGFLKLPEETAQVFIMGIVRRDFGAAGLNDLVKQGVLAGNQIVVALVAITLFVPCIAAIMVIFKERSLKESIAIWTSSFVLAFAVAGLLAQIIL
jgi:ferrous iron transport protein B